MKRFLFQEISRNPVEDQQCFFVIILYLVYPSAYQPGLGADLNIIGCRQERRQAMQCYIVFFIAVQSFSYMENSQGIAVPVI